MSLTDSRQAVVILSAMKWELIDERTNEKRAGVSVMVVPATHEDTATRKGCFPTKMTVESHLFDKFTTLPGVYRISVGLRAGAGGKAGISVTDCEYVAPIDMDAEAIAVGVTAFASVA